MSLVRQLIFCLAAVVVTVAAQAQPAGPVSVKFSPTTSTNLIPPPLQSPVYYFRQLLQMSAAQRNASLAARPPESRARVLAKVHEYLALDPDERELRLRATELRWYLTPLLQTPPDSRAARLAQVPPELQKLVKARLTEWDLLPPTLKQEFLANDKTLSYVAHVEAPPPPSPDPRQQEIAEQIHQFFDLKPGEKQKLLGTLSGAERSQMEKTLTTFDGLPEERRALCIRNYAKFAGMSDAERAEFLKNAESWAKMSPQERQTWRDLVARIPLWPPTLQMPPRTPPQITTSGAQAN